MRAVGFNLLLLGARQEHTHTLSGEKPTKTDAISFVKGNPKGGEENEEAEGRG